MSSIFDSIPEKSKKYAASSLCNSCRDAVRLM